ncbi:MAG TPA: ABC transporter permease [Longimicrobiales bacterium]|nr:ABC transporter permease [Longimicrobiales bacterium]
MRPPYPSRMVRALLRRLLGPEDQHALGDLDEEFARRLLRSGRPWSEVWYVAEALSLVFAVARDRVGATSRSDRGSPRPRYGTTSRFGDRFMGGMGRDLRHAVKMLLREPWTTLVIALTLAVAVGATTAIFAVADAALLRKLPYPGADRLVRVYSGSRDDPGATTALSPLDLRDLASFEAVIEEIGAWTVGETVHLTEGEEPRRLEAPRASASLFRILGLEPRLGRFFTSEEEVVGGDDAVVLSHGLWVGTYGADPGLVGRSITLDGARFRVVGVAPPEGMMPRGVDAWRALALGPEWYDERRWGWQFLSAVARVRPGVDPDAIAGLLTARLAESVPGRVERGQTRVVRTLYEERVGSTRTGLLLLFGAVALLLVMACANVMNVILARSEVRVREFGLRRALGSGAGPLVRLVALETAALAIMGGLGGLLLAYLGLQTLRAAELSTLAYLGQVRFDARVAGFVFALTVATAATFGVAPALRALRADPQTVLREAGARAGTSRAARRVRDALVVAQVALACTLLTSVGLSAYAFVGLLDRDPGFRAEDVLAAAIELPVDGYDGDGGVTFYRALLDRLRALPGVERAGAVAFLPLEGVGWSASIEIVNPDPAVTDPDPGANMRPVSTGYFQTLGIPLVEGRRFTDADDTGAAPVVIVDETIARRYWPAGSPVGRQVYVGALSGDMATIVGVVGSVPDESLASPGGGHVYFPVLQRPMRRMSLVLRTSADPATLAPALRAAIREVDPRIPITDLSTLEQRVGRSVAAPRAGLLLLGAFGVVAVLLAAVGIYGVLAYAVARRTREIGTRMALGAAPRTLLLTVVGRAMRLWAAGALIGALGAVAVAELFARYVQGVRVADPYPYALAFLGLGGVALLAALLPAVRATAVDPNRALRAE